MSQTPEQIQQPKFDLRMKIGISLFILSILLPMLGLGMVGAFDFTTATAAMITGCSLVAAELLGLIAIGTMGKSGFLYFKTKIFKFFTKLKPEYQISRTRHKIGLILFWFPILVGLFSPYIQPYFKELLPIPFVIICDMVFVLSFFVLGANFWEKLHNLFKY